jgi:hypothetical protein
MEMQALVVAHQRDTAGDNSIITFMTEGLHDRQDFPLPMPFRV